MSAVYIIATLRFKEGKMAKFEEMMPTWLDNIFNTEPNTLRFQVLREVETDDPRVILVEKYKTRADLDDHRDTEGYKSGMALLAEEFLVGGKGPDIVVVEQIQGFENR